LKFNCFSRSKWSVVSEFMAKRQTGSTSRQGFVVVADMFLKPTDWIMERTTHRFYVGLTLEKEVLPIWTLLMAWLSCLRCSKSIFLLES